MAAAPGEGDRAAELDARLEGHNATVAALGIGLRLERRGGRIGLRGLLPDRQGTGRRVQRLSLGLPATQEGLEHALTQLRKVAAQLEMGGFQWQDWTRPGASLAAAARQQTSGTERLDLTPQPRAPRSPAAGPGRDRDPVPPPAPSAVQAAEERWGLAAGAARAGRLRLLLAACDSFEHQFRDDPRRSRRQAGSRSTWTAAYRPYLRRLLQIAAESGVSRLSAGLLLQTMESYPTGSSGRQRCASALAALALQQGIELPADWRDRSGGYGLHAARFRSLPSDEQILELVQRIPNPAWRLVYGLMATYGLRNHEVFYSDLSALAPGGDRVLRVLPTSKTGEHQVWPFQPEWVETFELEQLGHQPESLPPIARDLSRTTLRQAGQRVAEQFRRYDLPITPYDLRHAWAVRTIHIGLPDTVAARMMGHSVAIHTRTYHHWITRRDQQRAVDAALARLHGV